MRAILIKRHWPGQVSKWKLFVIRNNAKRKYFSTSFCNGKNRGRLTKKYRLRGRNRRGEDARKILEDVGHRELVTRGSKYVEQSVPVQKPVQRCACALSRIVGSISKKDTHGAKNFPTAIQHITDQLRDSEDHQELRANGQKLLKGIIQPVAAKVSPQLSEIPHERSFKASIESALGILNNTRDELEAYIVMLQKNIEDNTRDQQLLPKELHEQLIHIQGGVTAAITDTKGDAKREDGIVNAPTENLLRPTLASGASDQLHPTVGVQNKLTGQGPVAQSNDSQKELSSIKESSQDGSSMDVDIETGTSEQHHAEAATVPHHDCGTVDEDESTNETEVVEAESSYLDAIQRKATEMLRRNLQTGVQKHVERLNVLKEEACGLGVEMEDAFAKCEEELRELSCVYTNRTKQMLQDMTAGTLTPITDVWSKISECSANVSELTREIKDSIKDQSSCLKLAALSVQTATTVTLVPIAVARILPRIAASVMRLPSQVSKIILANVQQAESRAGEIVGRLIKQVEENKEIIDD